MQLIPNLMPEPSSPNLQNPEDIGEPTEDFAVAPIEVDPPEQKVDLPRVNRETGIYTDPAGRRWATRWGISKILNPDGGSRKYISSLNLDKISGMDSSGCKVVLYDLDQAEEAYQLRNALPRVDKVSGIYTDPEGRRWATIRKIAKILNPDGDSHSYISSLDLDKISGVDSTGCKVVLCDLNQAEEGYELRDALPRVDEITGIYTDPGGRRWATMGRIAQILNPVGYSRGYVSSLDLEHFPGVDSTGRKVVLYDLGQAEEAYQLRDALPRVNKDTGIYTDTSGRRWATRRRIAKILNPDGSSRRYISSLGLDKILGVDSTGRKAILSDLDQAEKLWAERGDPRKVKMELVATVDRELTRKLFQLFGISSHSDILHLLSGKNFDAIPERERVAILRDYLGETMLQRVPLRMLSDPEVINVFRRLDELEQSVKDRMAIHLVGTVIKNGIIDLYSEMSSRGQTEEEFYLLATQWFERLKTEAGSTFLDMVLDRAKEDLDFIMAYQKPDNIVENIQEGRKFPDFYQRVNIASIRKNKRLLIADEMGMGKSASAIMAKETLSQEGKVRSALLVVPSNIIENGTWQAYLSARGENGGAKGYFVEGRAPRVKVITKISDLEDGDLTTNYDYIIISHERLGKMYLDCLEKYDFDMMIVDESHKLKKIEGARSDNLLRLSSRFSGGEKYLVMLSGTPVPNKVHDIAMAIKMLRSDIPEIRNISINALARQIIQGSLDLAQLAKVRGYLMSHMEIKRMTEGLVGHNRTETDVETELSDDEKEVYQVLLEDDDLTSSQKLQMLRQFLLNPSMLEPSTDLQGSKKNMLREQLKEAFDTGKRKIVVFVNGYVEGVIRGEGSILSELELPHEIEICRIHGDRSQSDDRAEVQRKIRFSEGKMVVFVSGQTSDVGVDFSGADLVIEYNEPWSLYDRDQQIGRVYRPGLAHDIEIRTLITGELEKGIREYIGLKKKAIEKLLSGIPLNELERRLVERSEVVFDIGDEGTTGEQEIRGLIEYLSSNTQTLNRIFAASKEIGESQFSQKVVNSEWGERYAEAYLLCGSRAYAPNCNRVHATIIDQLARREERDIGDLRILDLASGPEMLRRYSGSEYQRGQIVSRDINPLHFHNATGEFQVGGFMDLGDNPAASFDFVNLSLALHYAKYEERLNILLQINRVLKTGGHAVISLPYSLGVKDRQKFIDGLHWFGFVADDNFSGEVKSGNSFSAGIFTIRKTGNPAGDLDEIGEMIHGFDLTDGYKLKRCKVSLTKQDRILRNVVLAGREIQLNLNDEDHTLVEEERRKLGVAQDLRNRYGSIEKIPKDQLAQGSEEPMFVRLRYNSQYVLYSKLGGEHNYLIIK